LNHLVSFEGYVQRHILLIFLLHSFTMKRVRIARVNPKPTVHRIQEIQISSTKPKLLVSTIPKISTRKVTTNDNQNNAIPTSQTLSDFFILVSPYFYSHRQIFLPIRNSGSTKNKPQLATPITCTRSSKVNGTRWNMEAVIGM